MILLKIQVILIQIFGEQIANNVVILSENKEIKGFKERKKEFIDRLSCVDDSGLIIVEITDKLHNLLSDYELYKKEGKLALESLSTSYEMNKWYYMKMKSLFLSKFKDNELLERYLKVVNLYFGIQGWSFGGYEQYNC